MKKLDINNLDNISGGFVGADNFNFGEAETKEELDGWLAINKGDRKKTLEKFETMAESFSASYSELGGEKNLKKARYYSHLYNSLASGKYQ